MTIRLFNEIAAIPNHGLYPPPEPPAGPCNHEPVKDKGKFSLIVEFGSYLKVSLCPKVHWSKIGAAGRPHILRYVNNSRIQILHPSFKLPFDTARGSHLGNGWARKTFHPFFLKLHEDEIDSLLSIFF